MHIKKLLERLLNAYSAYSHKYAGLCDTAMLMHDDKAAIEFRFTTTEYKVLRKYLSKNLPKTKSMYCWPKFQSKPRIEWLQGEIGKC